MDTEPVPSDGQKNTVITTTVTTAPEETSTMWRSAHDTWNAVDIQKHMSRWDENYSQVVCNKEYAVGERQKLVAFVREFNTEAKGQEKIARVRVEALLQQFKGTIQTLLERSKFAEDSFIAMHQVVSTLPDPCPLLWSAHIELIEQQRAAFSLEERLRDAGRELELLKQQRRDDQRAMDAAGGVLASNQNVHSHHECEQRERQLRNSLDDAEQRASSAELDVSRLEKALKGTQESLMQANQLLAERPSWGGGEASTLGDDEHHASVEDLRSVIETLEHTVATLRGQRHVDAMKIGELETDVAQARRKEETSTRMVESLRKEKESSKQTVHALEQRVSELQKELTELETLHSSSTSRITEAHRNALIALQTLGWVPKGTDTAVAVQDIIAKHNTIVEAQTATLQKRLDTALATGAMGKASQYGPATGFKISEGTSASALLAEEWPEFGGHVEQAENDDDDGSRAVQIEVDNHMIDRATSSRNNAEQSLQQQSDGGEVIHLLEDDNSLVAALTKQRDALKGKLQLSEQRASRLSSELNAVKDRARTAHEDNVSLYTRVQYLEDVLETSGRSSGGAKPWDDAARREGIQRRYDTSFNDKFSPFADWTKKQKEQRMQSLSLVDRVALFFSASMLTSKYVRAFLVAYALMLHLVVFFTLAMTSARMSHVPPPRFVGKNSF
eukprot:PhM_4_TR10296/c0_g3_i1/m.15732/K09313/CUTL; homeobox protein cut-like